MSTNMKTFKKGEYLFKEGDKISGVQIIQSGAVTLCLIRPKKNLEMFQIGASQILGESAISGGTTYTLSAIATQETKVVEVPSEAFKQAVESAPQLLKALIKSLSDRLKTASNELRTYKMEKESAPCPEDQVARVYGTIYHSARYKGTKDEKDPNKVSVDWVTLKQYAQRVFGDSLKRVEQAINILVKLKLASYEMGRPPEDPEGPEQIMKVHFFDLPAIEAFFEFFQYYYYKGGKGELLKPDENATTMLSNLLKVAETIQPDRFGVVTMDFQKVIEAFKTNFGLELKADHFTRLEHKGLFAKRQARSDGTVILAFELKEFQNTAKIWRILKEIEKWNEKGFVDMTEEEVKVQKKSGDTSACPQCQTEVALNAKFCHECGFKMAA
jgi:CRP-like cAMP-binding protein